MRHFGRYPFSLAAMPQSLRGADIASGDLAVRLHDVSTGLAIGIALLKGVAASSGEQLQPQTGRGLNLIEESMRQLRALASATAAGDRGPQHQLAIADAIRREAERLKLRLELEVKGREGWLAPNHSELIVLVGRESLRNVRRHSGTSACSAVLDLTTCPFVLRVQDWGSGLSDSPRVGSGIQLLRQMAGRMGCSLDLGSQPGLGTEVILVGPVCAKDRDQAEATEVVEQDQKPSTRRRRTANGRRAAVNSGLRHAD